MNAINTTTSTDLGTAVFGSQAFLGLAAVLVVLGCGILTTWAVLRFWWVAFGGARRTTTAAEENGDVPARSSPFKGEPLILINLQTFVFAAGAAAVTYVGNIVDAAKDTFTVFFTEFFLIAGLILLAIFLLAFINAHDILLEVFFEVWQCRVRPLLDELVLPLLSVGRVLFALVWPFVNMVRDITRALTTGNYRIVIACTSTDVVADIFTTIVQAIEVFVIEVVDFIINGLLYNGRFDLLPTLVLVGSAINQTRDVADCYCEAIQPIWDLVYSIITLPSLYSTIDCAFNTVVRWAQIPINSIFRFEFPNTAMLADEATCAITSYGELWEDLVVGVIEFFYALFSLLSDLIMALTVEQRAPVFARVAAMHALADERLYIPTALRMLRNTPGAVPHRALSLVALSAADASIRTGISAEDGLFAFPGLVSDEALSNAFVTIESVNGTLHRVPASVVATAVGPLTIWSFLAALGYLATLGYEALLRLANTPWTRIVTVYPLTIISVINITINSAFNAGEVFDSPEGIAYWQIGFIGDYTRGAVDAVIQLLAFISASIPCSFSKPVQALLSIPELVVELLIGAVYTWIFPPWTVGVPPPVDCNLVTCGSPAPSGWSPLDVVPDYYSWDTSRLRRNLNLLLEGGECTAFLFGCNTTADNNPSTNITSNCTDTPLACSARSFNRIVTELVNNTVAFIFYIPDLVRFTSPGYKTAADIPVERLQLALYDFIFCIGLLIDSLDISNIFLGTSDMCLVDVAPPPRPTNPNVTLPPPGAPNPNINPIPTRSEWECRLDERAYFYDWRYVMVLNVSNPFDQVPYHLNCSITDSRGCNIAQTPDAAVQVLGSGPNSATTLVVNPPWIPLGANVSIPLVVTVNSSTGAVSNALPNATSVPSLADLSIASVSVSDCTFAGPQLPDTLGIEYACSAESFALFINSTSQLSTTRSAGFIYIEEPVPTPVPTPSPTPVPTPTPTPSAPPPPPPDPLGCGFEFPAAVQCIGGFLNIATALGNRFLLRTLTPPFVQQIPCSLPVPAPSPTPSPSPTPVAPSPPPPPPLQFVTPPNLICYRNALAWFLVYPPPRNTSINQSLITPIYAFIDPTSSTAAVPIGCEMTPPAGYYCDAAANYSMAVTEGLLYANLTTGPRYITCAVNSLPAAPVCTRVQVNYTDGSSVVVELEGGEVRVFSNDTRAPLTCAAAASSLDTVAALSNISLAAAGALEDNALPINGNFFDLRVAITSAQRQFYAAHDKRDNAMQAPVATREALIELAMGAASNTLLSHAGTGPRLERLLHFSNSSNTSDVYRKESFICCFSEVVTRGLSFFVAAIFEIVYLIQSVLTAIATPTPIEVPTFAEARDDLREALCRFACMITTIIPVTLSCPLTAGGTCGTLSLCGRNFLCDLFDVPILIVDFIVDVLTLLRAFVLEEAPDPKIFGPTCSSLKANAADCLVSFLIGVFTNIILTVTMVLRTAAGTLDCLFCVLARIADPTLTCPGIFYAIINPLVDLVDAIVASFLKAVITFVVGLIKMVVYLFSGKLDLLVSTFFNEVLKSIGDFIGNIATAIWKFIIGLPGIGKLVEIILNIIRGACDVLNDVIIAFGGSDIGCANIGKKRVAIFGWITFPANVTGVWQPSTGAASLACHARMVALNASDYAVVAADTELTREVLYCVAAHLWVGPVATPEAETTRSVYANECDLLLPSLYAAGHTWASLSAEVKARVVPCLENRLNAELVRKSSGGDNTWLPHDIFYNPLRVFQLLDEAWLAYDVYSQYASDQSSSAAQLVSQAYRDSWHTSGYDTTHLDVLAAQVTTVSEVETALEDPLGAFTLQAYATRTVPSRAQHGHRALLRRQYDARRVANLAAKLWLPLLGEPQDTDAPTLGSVVASEIFDGLERYADMTALSFPLTKNTLTRLASTEDSLLLTQTMGGWVRIWTQDVPGMLVRVLRTPARIIAENELLSKKRALESPNDVPAPTLATYLLLVVEGALKLSRDMFTGAVASAHTMLTNPVTVAWLQAQAHAQDTDAFRLSVGAQTIPWQPATDGSNSSVHQTLFSAGLNRIWTGFANFLPYTTTLAEVRRVLDMASSDPSSLVQTSASIRRVKLSRFTARIALMSSIDMRDPYVHGTTEVNNQTGLECLFGVNTPLPTAPPPNASSPTPTPTPTPTATPTPVPSPSPVNTTFNQTFPLCQDCLGLDQIIGRSVRAVLNALFFFGVPPPDCPTGSVAPGCVPGAYPSLNFTITQYRATQFYLADPNAVVIVGDGPDLPVVWPWRDIDNWRYWRDPTPNKIGFSDFVALWDATIDFLRGAVSNSSTGGVVTLSIASGRGSAGLVVHYNGTRRGSHGPINGPVQAIADAASEHLYNLFMNSSTSQSSGLVSSTAEISQGPFDTLQEVALAWFEYFWSWRACSYQSELDGSRKRFSIGESLIGFLLVFIVIAIVLSAILPAQLFVAVFGAILMAGLTVVLLFLILTYDYSYNCFPALPLGLADDAMYALVFSIWSKCLVGASVVNELSYDNRTCFSCTHWSSGWFSIPNFATPFDEGGLFGFEDLRYNLAFLLRTLLPGIYDAITPGSSLLTAPVIGPLISLDFFQVPLAAYANFSAETSTDRYFAQIWHGATWITGVPNIGIAIVAIYLYFKLLWPVTLLTLNFLRTIAILLLPLLNIVLTGIYMLSTYDPDNLLGKKKKESKSEDDAAAPTDEEEENLVNPTDDRNMAMTALDLTTLANAHL